MAHKESKHDSIFESAVCGIRAITSRQEKSAESAPSDGLLATLLAKKLRSQHVEAAISFVEFWVRQVHLPSIHPILLFLQVFEIDENQLFKANFYVIEIAR